jgi:hypothetical protein
MVKKKATHEPKGEYRRMQGQPPTRERKSESRFERAHEWRLMKADLDRADLKPNEYLQLSLNDEAKKEYGIVNRRTIARFIKKYLADNDLNKYTVKSFRREGKDFFIVRYTPVVRGVA